MANRKRGRPRLYPQENPVKGVEDNSGLREVEDEEEEEEEEDDRNQGVFIIQINTSLFYFLLALLFTVFARDLLEPWE